MKSTGLIQLVGKLHQAVKIHNLYQVCHFCLCSLWALAGAQGVRPRLCPPPLPKKYHEYEITLFYLGGQNGILAQAPKMLWVALGFTDGCSITYARVRIVSDYSYHVDILHYSYFRILKSQVFNIIVCKLNKISQHSNDKYIYLQNKIIRLVYFKSLFRVPILVDMMIIIVRKLLWCLKKKENVLGLGLIKLYNMH